MDSRQQHLAWRSWVLGDSLRWGVVSPLRLLFALRGYAGAVTVTLSKFATMISCLSKPRSLSVRRATVCQVLAVSVSGPKNKHRKLREKCYVNCDLDERDV